MRFLYRTTIIAVFSVVLAFLSQSLPPVFAEGVAVGGLPVCRVLPAVRGPIFRVGGRVFVEDGERRAVVRTWRLSGTKLPKAIISAGDFDCDGFDDLLLEDTSGQPLLAFSNGKHKFDSREPTQEAGLQLRQNRWRDAAAFDPERTGCSILLVPEREVGAVKYGSLCAAGRTWERLEWSKKPFSRVLGIYVISDPQVLGFFDRDRTTIAVANFPPAPEAHGNITIPEPYTFVGVANVEALEHEEFVFRHRIASFLARRTTEVAWAELPAMYSWKERMLLADFTGDGRTDLLATAEGFPGKWLIRSRGRYGIERPLSLSIETAALDFSATGDFDGDGIEEAVALQNGSILVLSLEPPSHTVPNVSIQTANGATASSRHDGSYLLESDSPLEEVWAELPGRKFSPAKRFLVETRRRERPVHFFQTADSHDEIGRSLSPEAEGPYVCNGAQIADSRWGRLQLCPVGYAYEEVDDAMGVRTGSCCRLPSSDILLDQAIFTKEVCPPDHIVTGFSSQPAVLQAHCPRCDYVLRCTALNTKNYTLSKAEPGRYYGTGVSGFRSGAVQRNQLPLSIRSGMGRVSYQNWDVDGCTGNTPGAVVVSARGKHCEDVQFARLLYRESNKEVVMFPACREMVDVFDSEAGCRPDRARVSAE